jgi:tetratricopeptide (TPR) repeat protein
MSSDKLVRTFRPLERIEVSKHTSLSAEASEAERLFRIVSAEWRGGQVESALLKARTVPANMLLQAMHAYELGQILNACGEFQLSEASLRRAVELEPNDLVYRKAHASALTTVGHAAAAETALRDLTRIDPGDAGLWYALAHNRVGLSAAQLADEIRLRLCVASRRDKVFLNFALGKCLEDAARYGEAFDAYSEGARLRRRSLQYDIGKDVSGIDALIELFRSEPLENPHAEADREDESKPIFVLGLPRTGTTLTERILTAHSSVVSIGEATILTHCLGDALRASGAPKASSRIDSVRRSLLIDMTTLGSRYMQTANIRAGGSKWFVDKMPLNFLYVGHIRRALPKAKIVLVRRNPLDSCWAMYTTLFNQAYPFSYDFQELSAYYAAFDRLANFWEDRYADKVFVLNYESLVEQFEPTVRNLVQSCALPWQDACLQFHENAAPVATASVSQVRKPLYGTSVGRWKQFENRLDVLRECLAREGVGI